MIEHPISITAESTPYTAMIHIVPGDTAAPVLTLMLPYED